MKNNLFVKFFFYWFLFWLWWSFFVLPLSCFSVVIEKGNVLKSILINNIKRSRVWLKQKKGRKYSQFGLSFNITLVNKLNSNDNAIVQKSNYMVARHTTSEREWCNCNYCTHYEYVWSHSNPFHSILCGILVDYSYLSLFLFWLDLVIIIRVWFSMTEH